MYNLFRKAGETPVHCAVPDGGALPGFLRGTDWSFEGKVADIRDRLLDADKPLFEAVVERTGYFVFSPL
jgi:hypothetical protein